MNEYPAFETTIKTHGFKRERVIPTVNRAGVSGNICIFVNKKKGLVLFSSFLAGKHVVSNLIGWCFLYGDLPNDFGSLSDGLYSEMGSIYIYYVDNDFNILPFPMNDIDAYAIYRETPGGNQARQRSYERLKTSHTNFLNEQKNGYNQLFKIYRRFANGVSSNSAITLNKLHNWLNRLDEEAITTNNWPFPIEYDPLRSEIEEITCNTYYDMLHERKLLVNATLPPTMQIK